MALSDPETRFVIVATPNDSLSNLAIQALSAGKDVLVEKPAGRSAEEISHIIEAAKRSGGLVRVGFNHRYHPALLKARALIDEGAIGPLMFIRSRYGHGGRIGYEKEWRANPKISGGGELIDQGVHLIDLSRWFLGDFSEVNGHAQTCFWDMPVDDNAFMILRTAELQTAFLHVSCSEWKNLFSFEIYGRHGKLQIEGLGGSYGVERLTWYKMLPEMGPPETTSWEYPQRDTSWEREFEEFLEDVRLRRAPSSSIHDAYAAVKIVESIYKRSGYDYRT
jgi:predicted dehydrogenase